MNLQVVKNANGIFISNIDNGAEYYNRTHKKIMRHGSHDNDNNYYFPTMEDAEKTLKEFTEVASPRTVYVVFLEGKAVYSSLHEIVVKTVVVA